MKLWKKSVFNVINWNIWFNNPRQHNWYKTMSWCIYPQVEYWGLSNMIEVFKNTLTDFDNSLYSFVTSECIAYQRNYLNTQSLFPIKGLIEKRWGGWGCGRGGEGGREVGGREGGGHGGWGGGGGEGRRGVKMPIFAKRHPTASPDEDRSLNHFLTVFWHETPVETIF